MHSRWFYLLATILHPSLFGADLTLDTLSRAVFLLESGCDSVGKSSTSLLIRSPSSDREYYLLVSKHAILGSSANVCGQFWLHFADATGGTARELIAETKPTGHPVVFHPTDTSTDVACLRFSSEVTEFARRAVPMEVMLSSNSADSVPIAQGADVVIVGMFPQLFDSRIFDPMIRFGKISMLPPRKILWERQLHDLILIECQNFRGFSGALALAVPDGKALAPSMRVTAVGVLQGFFSEARGVAQGTTWESSVPVYENVGIAAVVPWIKVRELLKAVGRDGPAVH